MKNLKFLIPMFFFICNSYSQNTNVQSETTTVVRMVKDSEGVKKTVKNKR